MRPLKLTFLHCPKAGGTAVAAALAALFPPEEVAPQIEMEPWSPDPELPERVRDYGYASGHFGWSHRSGDVVTNFRRPVARMVSLYDYWRSYDLAAVKGLPESGPQLARELAFAEFVRSDHPKLSLFIDDFHTRQLLDSGWTPRLLTPSDVETVKRRIDAMRWFYVCEESRRSEAWFHAVFGPGGIARANETPGPRTAPDPEDEDVILQRNQADLAIWTHARARLQRIQTAVRTGSCETGGAGDRMNIQVPVSAGELVDKITILRVKAERLDDPAKLANVRRELELLEAAGREHLPDGPELRRLTGELTEINARLWDIEEGKRDCERRQEFGPDFVALARSVYVQNDQRARVKREINVLTGSTLVEEKSYRPY